MAEIVSLIVEYHCSGIGFLQKIDTAKKCGLSASARTEDRDHISLFYRKINTLEHCICSKRFSEFSDLHNFPHSCARTSVSLLL